ncbi:hypothetical protein P886_2007 [Alteromonadaceae bacterium 2753L.S.0a.02]|nr:hypothetical protein P886_2007 [Alteromonadaceae bacterium 2753L.S.0a.02]
MLCLKGTMKEDPIQGFDSIDIVTEKVDGTVDLVIVVSSYLDSSDYNAVLLRRKVQLYVDEILTDEWQQKYGAGNSTILIKSVVIPHQEIINLIGAIKKYLTEFNIGLYLEQA